MLTVSDSFLIAVGYRNKCISSTSIRGKFSIHKINS